MNELTVLLTASGSQFAPGIIKCIKCNGERNIRVIGADMSADPSNKYMVDVFYRVPSTVSNDFIDSIISICKKEHVNVLLPQMSAELPIYLDHIQEFEAIGTIVSMTQNDNVNIANNKIKLFNFMKRKGISVPNYVVVSSFVEFQEGIRFLGYPDTPVVVKLPESSGARGIRVIDEKRSKYELFALEKPMSTFITLDDMESILKDAELTQEKGFFPELLLMQYLPGDEYDIDLLADHGRVLYIAGRRNKDMVMSISQTSVLEKNERAEQIATQLVNELELDGNIGFDYKFDADGTVHLLEINPRIDATVSIFAAGGLNLPYLRIKQLLGEDLPDIEIKYGTSMKRRYLETFVDAEGNLIDW